MLTVTSPAFAPGARMPDASIGRSIPLLWSGVPAGTKALAITTVDHNPVARMWVHWLVVAIPPGTASLPEGASGTAAMPPGARELTNTGGRTGWSGPSPPAGTGAHDYVTTVYALDIEGPDLSPSAKIDDFRRAVEGHVLASGSLTGTYSH